jgi:GNAT superfamily N-acetyltransferase
MTETTIRRATVTDATTIAEHRVGMFRDMGYVPNEELAQQLRDASIATIGAALSDGTYVGWLAINSANEVVAGAGVHIKPHLPRFAPDRQSVETGPLPLVVNVYTEPAWRQRGVARALMQTIMEWATKQGFDRVLLHSSDAGRPLYESLGFVPTKEMRWNPPRS